MQLYRRSFHATSAAGFCRTPTEATVLCMSLLQCRTVVVFTHGWCLAWVVGSAWAACGQVQSLALHVRRMWPATLLQSGVGNGTVLIRTQCHLLQAWMEAPAQWRS